MSTDPPTWPSLGDEPPPPPGLYEWTPSAPAAPAEPTPPTPRPPVDPDAGTVKLRPARRPTCLECGGTTDADGYCTSCGAKVPTPREHFAQAPVDWVGGVCDRGRSHPANEDAMAIWAAAAPEVRAVVVVCDGVSSSSGSDVAALAAAEAARDLLVARHPEGMAVAASHDAAMRAALIEATARANDAVVAATEAGSTNPASCTFAAVVVHPDGLHFGNVGDSRIYWIGTTQRLQLSQDHSMAEELIRAGSTRPEAESSDHAHAITRWLGRDAEDITPFVGAFPLTEDGWLLVCSDGLWNYASEVSDLATQLDAALVASDVPVEVAGRLVDWANAQGGKDNITVALARLRATLQEAPPTAQER